MPLLCRDKKEEAAACPSAGTCFTDRSRSSGFPSGFLIILFIRGVLSYIRYHQNEDRIFCLTFKWRNLLTHIPFINNFLDNPLQSGMRLQDRKLGRICGFSSSLALFLVAVGIFG